MQISKQRLIEIIKEELQEDVAGNPMFPVKDIERGAQLQQGDELDPPSHYQDRKGRVAVRP